MVTIKSPAWMRMAGPAVIALALCASYASPAHGAGTIRLDQGTVIPVTLAAELTSNGSHRGDKFLASVDTSNSAYQNMMQGATVEGVVRDATPQEGKNPGTLDLEFTHIRFPNGKSYAINGTPTSLNAKYVSTNGDGLLVAKNTNKDEHLSYAGYGAGAGALVSILGGKINVKDTLLDSVLGGLLGYGVGSVSRGPTQVHNVDLKPGMKLGVLLNSSVRFTRYSSDRRSNRNTKRHGTYVSNGDKYYWYNGREWAMNLATGERRLVSNTH